MSLIKRFVDYAGLERFWQRITDKYDKKLDSVTNKNSTIKVTNSLEIEVKVSPAEDNLLVVNQGLFVPKNHKLTFGLDKAYEYDGTKDVEVPVYDGTYKEN